MLRKLRDDFSPEYLAAVFDVAGPTFRDQQAEGITDLRRFDLKTQTFQKVEYQRLQGQSRGNARATWRSSCRTFGARWRRIASRFWSSRATRPTT